MSLVLTPPAQTVVPVADGRSFDVEIPKNLLMVGAEFPTIGDAPTFR